VIEQGKVKESGTHDELVARDGLYASLCRTSLIGME
jgi:ABC-type multidrug transport system fused ATPase/permease subunit